MVFLNPEFFVTYLIATTVLILMPGPIVTLVVANSLAYGTRTGLATVAGASSGNALLVAAGALGLTTVLALVPDLEVELVESGCCGMAGAFGYEAAHHDVSLRMAELDLLPAVRRTDEDTIVVADGTAIRMQQGKSRKDAAVESATRPAWPLLGATVIAVMAFFPIYASDQDAGEYAGSLFTVVAISLIWSWVIALTVTPLQCMDMLPDPEAGEDAAEPFSMASFASSASMASRFTCRSGPR